MAEETPIKNVKGLALFHDDSVTSTPLPQATSTVNRRPKEWLNDDESLFEKHNFLKDTMNIVKELKAKLQNIHINNCDEQTNDVSVQTSAENKRSTFILDKSSVFRDSVREKALKALQMSCDNKNIPTAEIVPIVNSANSKNDVINTANNLPPLTLDDLDSNKENNCPSIPYEKSKQDHSDFEVLSTSLIDQDENNFRENIIEARDISLSGIEVDSQMALNHLPQNESVLEELGPAYPFYHASTSFDTSKKSEIQMINNSSSQMTESFISPEYFENKKSGIDYLSLSGIDEALKSMPTTATPRSIVDNFLKVPNKPKDKMSINNSFENSRNDLSQSLSSLLTSDLINFSDLLNVPDSNISQKYDMETYNIVAVKGCATEMVLKTSFKNTIWQLVSSDPNKILVKIIPGGPENSLRVLFLPYVAGKLQIKIKEEYKINTKYHEISILAEKPEIEIKSKPKFNFGKIASGCEISYKMIIKNHNNAMVSVLPNFTGHENFFKFQPDSEFPETELNLFAGEEVTRYLIFNPKLDYNNNDNNFLIPIHTIFELYINIPTNVLPKMVVSKMEFFAFIYKPIIMIKTELTEKPFSKNELRSLPVQLVSSVDTKFKIFTKGPFSVQPEQLEIQGGKLVDVQIKHNQKKDERESGCIYIQIMPKGMVFKVNLTVEDDKVAKGNSKELELNNEKPSTQCISSESENVAANPKPLNLQCTASELVWGSVSLIKEEQRSCWIRTVKTIHTEKLLFSIEDATNSFTFIHNDNYVNNMKIRLRPNEKEQLIVKFKPTVTGQICGIIQISRIDNDNSVKTVRLFGFGGQSKLTTHGIVLDLDSNLGQIILNNSSLSAVFEIQNYGDGVGFFHARQFTHGAFVEVSNTKGCIASNEKISIEVKLDANPLVIDNLLSKDKRSIIRLSSLDFTFCEESTRLRLIRLHKKYPKHIDTEISNKINEWKNFPEQTEGFQKISKLKDPLESLKSLYVDGVHHWVVEIVVSRKALEAAKLDLTKQFVELPGNITFEETQFNNTTAIQETSSKFYRN